MAIGKKLRAVICHAHATRSVDGLGMFWSTAFVYGLSSVGPCTNGIPCMFWCSEKHMKSYMKLTSWSLHDCGAGGRPSSFELAEHLSPIFYSNGH